MGQSLLPNVHFYIYFGQCPPPIRLRPRSSSTKVHPTALFADESTLDWEPYLYHLIFSFNTSFHQLVKNTPFFLTFGMEAWQPVLPGPELRRKFNDDSTTDNMMRWLLLACNVACQNDQQATI